MKLQKARSETTKCGRDAGVLVPMFFAGSLCAVAWLIAALSGHHASTIGDLALFCFGVFLGQLVS